MRRRSGRKAARAFGTTQSLHPLARVIDSAPPGRTETEDDLALLIFGEVDRHVDRGARVEPRPDLVGKLGAAHGRGIAHRAVAADELAAVAGYGDA